MNLHIVPDNVFSNKFYANLEELGVLEKNRVVVRTNAPKLRSVKYDLPFARLYSPEFKSHCGNTAEYDTVFIHQFTPLLYRWVATNEFKNLNWMVWGADLYNLPGIAAELYEEMTLSQYIRRGFSLERILYQLKVSLLHQRFKTSAYKKVRRVLTWMKTEYDFAKQHLPVTQAQYEFFFYENELPYQALDKIIGESPQPISADVPTYILGNSSSPDLNHLDAVSWMHRHGIKANLRIPVSYGDKRYADFLRKRLAFYKGGQIQFVDRYMNIEEYLRFLYQSDGLIMNNIRPQGYGNVFMMMYLGKKVFLNEKNVSTRDLAENGLAWFPLHDLADQRTGNLIDNRAAVLRLLSHDRLMKVYQQLF